MLVHKSLNSFGFLGWLQNWDFVWTQFSAGNQFSPRLVLDLKFILKHHVVVNLLGLDLGKFVPDMH